MAGLWLVSGRYGAGTVATPNAVLNSQSLPRRGSRVVGVLALEAGVLHLRRSGADLKTFAQWTVTARIGAHRVNVVLMKFSV
ncbi:MAG: hypothetical protein U0X92_13280 [Anaerolineales bacterium]